MVNSDQFAKRLQKIIDHHGVSATAFADRIEVNRSTISHLLSGRNKPSLDFVMKVIRHYPDVGLYWLLNGKGEYPPPESVSGEVTGQASLTEETRATQVKKVKDSLADPSRQIDRIVIFYSDGSFSSYTP